MFVLFCNRIRVEAENLKNQEEAERIDREATEDALRQMAELDAQLQVCLLYTSPSPRDKRQSRMPSSA